MSLQSRIEIKDNAIKLMHDENNSLLETIKNKTSETEG